MPPLFFESCAKKSSSHIKITRGSLSCMMGQLHKYASSYGCTHPTPLAASTLPSRASSVLAAWHNNQPRDNSIRSPPSLLFEHRSDPSWRCFRPKHATKHTHPAWNQTCRAIMASTINRIRDRMSSPHRRHHIRDNRRYTAAVKGRGSSWSSCTWASEN